jgi:hypothetical protein
MKGRESLPLQIAQRIVDSVGFQLGDEPGPDAVVHGGSLALPFCLMR